MGDNCPLLRWSSSCNKVGGCVIWFLLTLSFAMIAAQRSPERTGCHLVGFSKNFSPPYCQRFLFNGNACRGYCESWSFPTNPEHLGQNPLQVITSVSQCCAMDESEDITVSLQCANGIREFTLTSAISCRCSQCKKDFD